MPAPAAGAGIGPGSRLGSYTIDTLIGRGAMGMVYRGRHVSLDREVAVKVLQSLVPDADARARFRREAQAIARLRHPSILTLHDYGELDGIPFMITEYLPGGSLADRLAEGKRPGSAETLRLLDELAAALDHAHGHGIVHRDVKPGNVLMAADGSAVLTDFGLARLLESSAMTATGISMGTPYYMAPEQVTRTRVGEAADRYALATMAYQLLTGTLPFEGDEVLRVLYAKVHWDPEAPSVRDPHLPEAVDKVVLKGLSRDPADRWQACQEMISELRLALTRVGPTMVLARPRPRPRPLVAIVEPPPAPKAQRQPDLLPAAAVPAAVAPSADLPAALSPTLTLPRRALVPDLASEPQRSVAATRPGRRWGLWAGAGLAALVIILAVLHARQTPTYSLPNLTVQAGGLVDYAASGLPDNVQVSLLVDRRLVGHYRTGTDGALSATFRVPLRQPAGNYPVRVCWSGSCPAHGTLVVTPAHHA